jgi:preprotein translocase subunit SecD
VQDTAKAKDILGRTATLEMRWWTKARKPVRPKPGTGPVPFGAERYLERDGQAVIVKSR